MPDLRTAVTFDDITEAGRTVNAERLNGIISTAQLTPDITKLRDNRPELTDSDTFPVVDQGYVSIWRATIGALRTVILKAASITTEMLAEGSIEAKHIAKGAITEEHFSTDAVNSITSAAGGVLIGTYHIWGGAEDKIPADYLLCDGRNISRTDYAELFDVLGTKWGHGNGTTTFTLPCSPGRYMRFAGNVVVNGEKKNFGGGEVGTYQSNNMGSHKHSITRVSAQATPWSDLGTRTYNPPTETGSASGGDDLTPWSLTIGLLIIKAK